jgi:heme exporter protein D
MNNILITTIAIAVLLIAINVLAIVLRRRMKIDAVTQQQIRKQWIHAKELTDLHRRILEADKVLDQTLKALGYKGSVADKLRDAEKYIPDIDDVWRAHKLRNRIAHEPGTNVREADAQKAMDAFEGAIAKFVALP